MKRCIWVLEYRPEKERGNSNGIKLGSWIAALDWGFSVHTRKQAKDHALDHFKMHSMWWGLTKDKKRFNRRIRFRKYVPEFIN